jgi:rhodanese-related sulfurtransferase
MKTISMHELYLSLPKLKSDEVILDVRSKEEYQEGHVPNSINIPHSEVQNHIGELKKYKTIYIHCHAGTRAQIASQILKNAGLNNIVCIASSGMADWMAAGFPIEK